MKTEITRFCAACLESLHPLPQAVADTIDKLEAGSERELLEPVLSGLNDVRARLRSLIDKLSTQQAYLLIFGPLKSGKSTLMNALSGTYVSEVTSLPGYPCLVFVRNAAEPHFSATRYNGRETLFTDGRVLKDVISDSHFALAEQIRSAEKRGESFDPRTHFTEAIRRIDINLPVQSLAESGTVLVDTPGLYSRMNFGYDVLTKEFRDSAACAVFVVKTDNLFLEQVFAEFTQLLDLFSRIFLVINVDSNKRDLQPDGSLQPSAESSDPQQVIDAFTTLCMVGPLRRAYDEGRLRLHAVDLLSAAASFLTSGAPAGNNGSNGSDGHNGSNGEAAPHPENKQRLAFEAFNRDLTDYLNSSDYTHEFIRDSLRQGTFFCHECITATKGDSWEILRSRQQQLRESVAVVDEKIAAVDRLLAEKWEDSFSKVKKQQAEKAVQLIGARSAQLGKDLKGALDRWYEGSDSLRDLAQLHWSGLLREAGSLLSNEITTSTRSMLQSPLGGSEPSATVMLDLHVAGVDVTPVATAAQPSLSLKSDLAPFVTSISGENVPVRKTLGDWLLFRSLASVRRRTFGEDLSQAIAPEVKSKRLADGGRAALDELAEKARTDLFPKLPQEFSDKLFNGYVAKYVQELQATLKRRKAELEAERAELQAPFEANAQILTALDTMRDTAAEAINSLERLADEERALGHTLTSLTTLVPTPAPATEPEAETAAAS
jgi:signal recognition particle receptor subunit beta